jgi:D-alanyl-lipoteichoic acid acyltransferase DltB (MBOAT superfamily)
MLFPTVEYALFLIAVLAIAWSLCRFREAHKAFLLLASYLFYGFWNWSYLPLLIGISVFSQRVARRIQQSESAQQKKRWLTVGVVVCLATLAYYKYTGFLLLNLSALLGSFAPRIHLPIHSPLLPLGVSFFVFHAISLLGDCYRGKVKQPVKLLDALLYVAFFPQLIAGPILRASRFLPQLEKRRNPHSIRVNRALLLIVGGLFKKVILSNMLATRLVEPVFLVPQSYGGGDALLAVYGYAAQIYCDFSGYTDIAIGCALLLGYRFPRNFHAPYTAADPQDFWRRWHISLSSWLRNYLYFPLGGSRRGNGRTYLNLMLTMLLGGLWHGAGWTFVAWGALHGSYLVIHRFWSRVEWEPLKRWRASLAWRWIAPILLFHAVCAAWVFFRASSFELAFAVFGRLGVPAAVTLATGPVLMVLLLGLGGQFAPSRWRNSFEVELGRWPPLARGAALAAAIVAIEILGPTGVAPFIYFQF